MTDIRLFDQVYQDGTQDFIATLNGETMITGSAYEVMRGVCVQPIESDRAKIPTINEIKTQNICFADDYLTAKQQLDVSLTESQEHTVRIRDFELRYSHKGRPGAVTTLVEKP